MQSQLEEPTEVYEKDRVYARHKAAHPKGGFHMSYVNDTKNNDVVKSVLKQIGSKIVKGEITNIMTISKPAALCKDISYLEVIAIDLQHLDMLKLAAQKQDNPIFQMKCVITHTISSLYLNPEMLYTKAPIDNLLGETCHLQKDDGTHFYGESIKSSPPQARYHIIGPNKMYQIYGSHQVGASITPSLNALNGVAYGTKTIEFENGNIFEVEYSQLQIQGLLIGDRVMHIQKTFKIKNQKSNLVAEIKFYFENQSQVSKVASSIIGTFFGGKKEDKAEKRKQDDFDVQIEKIQNIDGDILKAVVSKGNGNWLEYIQFDGIVFWKIDQKEQSWYNAEPILPSDCIHRLDRGLIGKGLIELAEKQKILYEERDRKDRENRKQHKKHHKNHANNKK